MTTLKHLSLETMTLFFGRLTENGVSAEMIAEIIRDHALARVVSEAIVTESRFALAHGLFTSATMQIARIQELNRERGWGFSEDAFREVEVTIPEWPTKRLVAVTLVPYLETPFRTFHELWSAAAKTQDASWQWDGYEKVTGEKIRPLAANSHQPGLRWEVIDYDCGRNKKPIDIRNPLVSPHAGVLASAVLHPTWISSMNGADVPFVWVPGYEVWVAGEAPWKRVPVIAYMAKEKKIGLHVGWCDRSRKDYAIPAFV